MPSIDPALLPFRASPPADPEMDGIREQGLAWARDMGLVTGPDEVARLDALRLDRMSGYTRPSTGPVGRQLHTDVMSFFAVQDDLFDGPLGLRPAAAAEHCERMAAILYTPPGRTPADATPLERAFSDLWERSRTGMSHFWERRAALAWEAYFRIHVHEVIDRVGGQVHDFAHYLSIRRDASGTPATCVTIEASDGAGAEVPPVVHHSPQMEAARHSFLEVIFYVNDLHSLEKEEAAGDVDNVVLVLEKEGRSRSEAIAHMHGQITRAGRDFMRVHDEALPRLCGVLRLDDDQRKAVDRHMRSLAEWLVGYTAWGNETARYQQEFWSQRPCNHAPRAHHETGTLCPHCAAKTRKGQA